MFQDNERFLLEEWIAPVTFGDFRDLDVLEAGCGGGHTAMLSPVARRITAVDLNTATLARQRHDRLENVRFIDADIATMDLGEQFDIVLCIGVIRHTDDPTRTFQNLYRHRKPGGRMVIWTYSAEGNGLVRFAVEPLRRFILTRVSRRAVVAIARLLTIALYPIV